MSQTRSPGGGRYQRSTGGLVGAMVVTVLAVAGLRRRSTRSTPTTKPTPVAPVDYTAMVRAGRADDKLARDGPDRGCPAGWKATSATYETGTTPTWHLGLLTDKGKYVGVEEALGGVEDLVEEHVDPDAEQGEDVTIDGADLPDLDGRGRRLRGLPDRPGRRQRLRVLAGGRDRSRRARSATSQRACRAGPADAG